MNFPLPFHFCKYVFSAFKTNRERRSDGFSKNYSCNNAPCSTVYGKAQYRMCTFQFSRPLRGEAAAAKSFLQPRLFAKGKCNSLRGRYTTFCRRSESISWFSSFSFLGKTGEEDRFRKLEAEASKDNEHSRSEETMDRVGEME